MLCKYAIQEYNVEASHFPCDMLHSAWYLMIGSCSQKLCYDIAMSQSLPQQEGFALCVRDFLHGVRSVPTSSSLLIAVHCKYRVYYIVTVSVYQVF